MKRPMMILAAAACLWAAPAMADECCSQGKAVPWKGYNKGIQWSVGLSREPLRWTDLKGKDLTVTPGSSLAERRELFGETLKANSDWKRGLQPALERARKENKLLLFFQLVGDLDLEGC